MNKQKRNPSGHLITKNINMIDNRPFKVFVVRHKATITVEKIEVFTVNTRGVVQSTESKNPERFLSGAWFKDKEQALAKAERIRIDEIKYHEDQIEKLKNMRVRIINKQIDF